MANQQQQQIKLTQMKECVHMLDSSSEKYGDPTLERFLIARSMDPNKAAKMFVSWRKWRTSFVPLGFIPDSEVLQQLEPRKIFLQGLCKSGHPLMILDASKHYPAKDHHQFKKFVVHLLDKGIARRKLDGKLFRGRSTGKSYYPDLAYCRKIVGVNTIIYGRTMACGIRGTEIGNEKMVVILDLQKLSYKNVDARGLISGFQFLQAYYPERLARLYILNMPWFFVSVWKMVSHFLEKATLNKIVMVNNEEQRKQFVAEVGKEALPEEFGGNARLVALQDVEAPQLEC